jgi:hypothetical protein
VSQVFPKWSNSLPKVVGATLTLVGVSVVWGVTYYFTPKYWEVGYRPEQPVDYNHQLHAGKLGIDCRYCHSNVEESGHSNVPDTATCMNCHTGEVGFGGYLNSQLWAAHETDENLVAVRGAYASGEPIRWKRIHKLPDYVHFNHAVHVNAGVSCYSCHGRMDQQEVAEQVHSLSMSWCLDCHRNPAPHLVDASDVVAAGKPRITNMRAVEELLSQSTQRERGAALEADRRLQPPENCGACHY